MGKRNNNICTLCGKPIVLVPSARERAKKYGGTAEYYRNLFTAHSHCEIEARTKGTRELVKRITCEGN